MNKKIVQCRACGIWWEVKDNIVNCPRCGSKHYYTEDEYGDMQKKEAEDSRRRDAVNEQLKRSFKSRITVMKRMLITVAAIIFFILLFIIGSINSAVSRKQAARGIENSLKYNDYESALSLLNKLDKDPSEKEKYKREIWNGAVTYCDSLANNNEYDIAVDLMRSMQNTYQDAKVNSIINQLLSRRILEETEDYDPAEALSKIEFLMDEYELSKERMSPELKAYYELCSNERSKKKKEVDAVLTGNIASTADVSNAGCDIFEANEAQNESTEYAKMMPVRLRKMNPYIGYNMDKYSLRTIVSNTGVAFSDPFNNYGGEAGSDFDNSYLINGEYSEITATAFIPDCAKNSPCRSRLTIIGDGRELFYWDGKEQIGIKPFEISVNISSVETLQIKLEGYSTICLDSVVLIP